MFSVMPPEHIFRRNACPSWIVELEYWRAGAMETRIMTQSVQTNAMKIFESGPMTETKISSRRRCEKFIGLIGTGFAQAMNTLPTEMSESRGMITDRKSTRLN